ncbi:unnamed protein product [Ambrosiozyma monospora]|uniref:Unnamed protein product n=1 Tax=Ambrosiozyma monospora TaxID=43982 RepID=A0ACB5TAT9_AMBMO|nr:unnamed protein product [Ambrosiozyma monospora]
MIENYYQLEYEGHMNCCGNVVRQHLDILKEKWSLLGAYLNMIKNELKGLKSKVTAVPKITNQHSTLLETLSFKEDIRAADDQKMKSIENN